MNSFSNSITRLIPRRVDLLILSTKFSVYTQKYNFGIHKSKYGKWENNGGLVSVTGDAILQCKKCPTALTPLRK
jgi:hypothetical protein